MKRLDEYLRDGLEKKARDEGIPEAHIDSYAFGAVSIMAAWLHSGDKFEKKTARKELGRYIANGKRLEMAKQSKAKKEMEVQQ